MDLEERIDSKVDEINDIYIKTTEIKNSVHKLLKSDAISNNLQT